MIVKDLGQWITVPRQKSIDKVEVSFERVRRRPKRSLGSENNMKSTYPTGKVKLPEEIYTYEETLLAKSLIEKGHRNRLRVVGSPSFREKTLKALRQVKTAGYYDLLRAYVRRIVEVQGFSQLREANLEIWANVYTVENTVEAASFFVQKAWQMKMYLEGKPHYDSIGERDAVEKRLEFLNVLAKRARNPSVKEECEKRLRLWDESKFL